jgi:hypothetical protein
MTRWLAGTMGQWRRVLLASLLLLVLSATDPVQAHEQKTLTVILLEEGVASGNVTDPSFIQGNAVWFRMEDATNNTSMVVRLDVDQDSVFNASTDFESPVLVHACELDENGSLKDGSCAVSATYAFAANASVGNYTFWIHRTHEGEEEVWTHFISVHEDVHEEGGPSPGDCFGLGCEEKEENIITAPESNTGGGLFLLLATIALIGMLALSLSILKERGATTNLKSNDVLEEE